MLPSIGQNQPISFLSFPRPFSLNPRRCYCQVFTFPFHYLVWSSYGLSGKALCLLPATQQNDLDPAFFNIST